MHGIYYVYKHTKYHGFNEILKVVNELNSRYSVIYSVLNDLISFSREEIICFCEKSLFFRDQTSMLRPCNKQEDCTIATTKYYCVTFCVTYLL